MRIAATLLFVLFTLTATVLVTPQSTSEVTVAENSWTANAPMKENRANCGIAAINGRIYVFGGDQGSPMGNTVPEDGASYQTVNFTEEYDPASDTWSFKKPMPTPTNGQANVVDSRIYVIGGGSNETLNQIYDPATDSWTAKSPMPTDPRFWGPNSVSTLVSTAIDNKIFVLSYAGSAFRSWIYDAAGDYWSSAASSPSELLTDGYWWSQAGASSSGANAARRIYVFFARYASSTAPANLAQSVG